MAWSPAGSTGASRRPTPCPCRPWSRSRRASTCRGTRRCPDGCGPSGPRSSGPRPPSRPRGCARRRSGDRPAPGHRARPRRRRGPGTGPRPGRTGDPVMSVLCLVELDGAAAADASLRALTLARSLGDSSVRTLVFGDSGQMPAAALAEYGVSDVYVLEPSAVDGYAPQAWARVLAGLASETGATAVLAAGTDR